MLFLDCKDDGDASVAGIKGVKVRDITTPEEFEETYWWLRDNPKAFGTVVVDTVTQLQQIKIEEIGGKKAEKKGKQAGDWGVMTKQDWGEVSAWMKTWITNYRDLPMEVVFLAQDRVFNVGDDEEGTDGQLNPEVGPRLSPATMLHLCAAVSVVGNTFIRQREVAKKVKGYTIKEDVTEYCLRLGPSASYITKFRKPKQIELPDFLIDPTFEEVLETIKGAK